MTDTGLPFGLSLQEIYSLIWSKGLCYDCLIKGYMKRKCRNRLKCYTCGRCLPTVLHYPTSLPEKSSNNKRKSTIRLTLGLVVDEPTVNNKESKHRCFYVR